DARERTADRRDIRGSQRAGDSRTGGVHTRDVDRVEFIVYAGVDVNGVVGPKAISPQQSAQQRLGGAGEHAVVAVGTDGGRIHVAGGTGVVHVIAVACFRDRERLLAPVD